jgi:DNA polymerase III subunit delta
LQRISRVMRRWPADQPAAPPMKVAPQQVGAVLRDPSRFMVILLHGDDAGLIRERATAAVRAVVGPVDDPFRSSVLVREEHGRVLEEAAARSMVGGRRAVRVLDAADGLALLLSRLGDSTEQSLVVLEGHGLASRSKLRTMAEKHPLWATIACYPQSGAALTTEIKRAVEAGGHSITTDALQYLTAELGQDLATRQAELEKLLLFASGSPEIDREMAVRCCATSAEPSFSAMFGAVMRGDLAAVEKQLQEVAADGASGPGLIAGFSGYAQRILKVRLAMDAGQSGEDACKTLYPPVFFSQTAGFLREVRLWPSPELVALLSDVRVADLACKRAGSRDVAIAGQFLVATARRALRRARAGAGSRPA